MNSVFFNIAGVLITGGGNTAKTELYVPSSNLSCPLPSLPVKRAQHTVSKDGMLCGGSVPIGTEDYADQKCVQWQYIPMMDSCRWETMDLIMDFGRYDHVSWTPANGSGTYLMGGCNCKTTTLIKPDGTQEHGFMLRHRLE